MFVPIAEANEDFERESEQWSQTANQIVRWVEKGDLLEARTQLAILAKQFSKSDLSDKNLGVEGIHVLSDVIMDLERNLNQIKLDEQKISYTANRLQIAFDAVSHPHQPLWQHYYTPMKKHVKHIQEAIQQKNQAVINEAIQQFYDDYQLIRPALIVSKSPFTVEKVDSLITFIRKQNDLQQLSSGMNQLESLLQPLFFGSEQDVMAIVDPFDDVSAKTMIFFISGIIAVVLAYVSWRKYRGMKEITQAR